MASFNWLSQEEFKALTSAQQLRFVKELIAFLKEEQSRHAAPAPDELSPAPDLPPRK